jgi:hypothetical protein
VTGSWKKLHNFVRFTKYYYGDEIKFDEMVEAYSTYESDEKYTILFGKSDGSGKLGRPWRRTEENIKMDFRERG